MAICRIEEAVWHILANDADVATVLGSKIYHDAGKVEDEFPLGVIRVDRSEQYHSLAGPTHMGISDLSVSCIAESRSTAHDTAVAMKSALNGFNHGTVTLSSGDTCFISCIQSDFRQGSRETSPDGNDIGVHSAEVSYRITHQMEV